MGTRAEEIIETLGMQPHPERGWFVETYRSTLRVSGPRATAGTLPHGGERDASTAICFLLTAEQPATWLHRLKSDELFHLYEGGPLDVLILEPGGEVRSPTLGLDLGDGERPQLVIPAGAWFAAELREEATHCLFGCTVAPGFDFADFELAAGPELEPRYPSAADRIRRLSRPT